MEVGVKDKILTVIAPLKDTPAEKAGIRSGDMVLKIDDKYTSDVSIDEAIKLIRGDKGTTVKLTILHEGESEPVEISVVRDTIKIPTIDTRCARTASSSSASTASRPTPHSSSAMP
ncbi:MAG: PDZ domain-containing protein [bacterium]